MKISGKVQRHIGRGKRLGFPTANIEIGDGNIEDGIYVGYTVIATPTRGRGGSHAEGRSASGGQSQGDRHVRLRRTRDDEGEKKLPSLIFVGAAETFGETDKKAEVYILDFKDNLYGKHIELELLQKIRDSRKFGTQEELIEQMKKDEEVARKYFSQQ